MPHRSDTLYNDLKLEGTETKIRLVHLEKAAQIDAPLHATLQVCSLDNETPSYTALSYTWRTDYWYDKPAQIGEQDTCWITCNGRRRQVTNNLHSALRTLRHLGHEVVWVDQICTDQGDPDDRDAQVAIMDRIYSRAAMTFIYLGIESEASHTALQHYDVVRAHILRYIELRKACVSSGSPRYPRLDWKIIRDWTALYNHYAWFYRIWVIQELLLARHSVFAIGVDEYNADVLLDGPGAFLEQFYAESTERFDMENWSYIRYLGSWLFVIHRYRILGGAPGRVDPLTNLHYLRVFGATDSRDRIYAVTSLLGITFKPDYTSPTTEVYIRLAHNLLAEDAHRIYQLVLYSGRQQQYLKSLPSWVPDWSASVVTTAAGRQGCALSKTNFDRVSLTAVNASARLISIKDVRLYARNPLVSFVKYKWAEAVLFGAFVGQVKTLTQPLQHHGNGDKVQVVVRWHREARRFVVQTYSRRLPSYLARLRGYLRLLCEISAGPNAVTEYLRRSEALEESLVTGAVLSSEFSSTWFWRQRLCFTGNGHMALVPSEAQQEDWIALISGHEWPVVLRSVRSGRYEHIGGAIVLDLIQDENKKTMSWDPQVFWIT